MLAQSLLYFLAGLALVILGPSPLYFLPVQELLTLVQ
jgi:hypothetical protein